MTLTLSHTFVWCLDQDESLRFYCDVLGLEKRQDADLGFMRWLTVGAPSEPGLEIGLMLAGAGAMAADGDELKALLAKGSLGSLIFRSEDVRGDFERIRATGAEVTQELKQQGYGVVDCSFRDPSGNMIRISQESGVNRYE